MNQNPIHLWIYSFLIRQIFKKKKKEDDIFLYKYNYKNLKLKTKTIHLFQDIIFNITGKIGKKCRTYHIFDINVEINQYDIIKSFTSSKFLNNSIWLFKFRKYFSKFHVKKKKEKTG